MKLSSHTGRNIKRRSILLLCFIALIALGLYILKVYKSYEKFNSKHSEYSIFCGAEVLHDEKLFVRGSHFFEYGNTQSDDFAFEGFKSSKVTETQPRGMSYRLYAPQPGSVYEASVWVKRTFRTAASIEIVPQSDFKASVIKSAIIDSKGDWELIRTTFSIPDYQIAPEKHILIAPTAKEMGNFPVYFDNLEIRLIKQDDKSAFEVKTLYLNIPQKAKQKFQKKIQSQHKDFILRSSDNDWAKAEIQEQEKTTPIIMRLKGDWMDHLAAGHHSYRIRVENDQTWNRLVTFNIQKPKTRGHLYEWVLHQLFEEHDILTPRYEFIRFYENNTYKGIYALEEHFEKQLLEYKQYREGPILRLVEDGMWDIKVRGIQAYDHLQISQTEDREAYESSPVRPFKENKTFKNPTLANQYKIAQNLLVNYKSGKLAASQVFDVEKLAQYYAIVDIMAAYHGTRWHNQRFYYNPVTSLLEPIGYDGSNYSPRKQLYLGYDILSNDVNDTKQFVKSLFTDQKFVTYYYKYLYQYTTPQKIESYFALLDYDVQQRIALIQEDEPKYSFTTNTFVNRARDIHFRILPTGGEITLQTFRPENQEGSIDFQVVNYHHTPLEVVGFGLDDKTLYFPLSKPVFLPAYETGSTPKFVEVKENSKATHTFYKVPGIDSVFTSPISKWAAPTLDIPRIQLFENLKIKSNDIYSVSNNTIVFKQGKHQVSNDILIPENYSVIFEAGVQLDIINKAKFISYSPIQMYGTAEQPIFIESSDKSAQGFTILQAEKASEFNYVKFSNLNTLNYEGWTLTGAVTLYESDVTIKHCEFTKNHCEDGLNIIRSDFVMKNSVVSYTFSDGFDADFCTGEIQECRFIATGNDGMDFSTSTISIHDCLIENAGDKGISVGEQATVSISGNTKVDGAVIGVASKDLSQLTIENINLNNCKTAFAAYQKKPEYGGGTITVKQFTADAYTSLTDKDDQSTISLPE